MPRARPGAAGRRSRRRILKQAKGYYGARGRLLRSAKEAVRRAAVYATRDRQQRKRDFRRLWITRVTAAARLHGISYSRMMSALHEAGIALNRKMLADLALHDPAAFQAVLRSAGVQSESGS